MLGGMSCVRYGEERPPDASRTLTLRRVVSFLPVVMPPLIIPPIFSPSRGVTRSSVSGEEEEDAWAKEEVRSKWKAGVLWL